MLLEFVVSARSGEPLALVSGEPRDGWLTMKEGMAGVASNVLPGGVGVELS
jgi:hypothetical protein